FHNRDDSHSAAVNSVTQEGDSRIPSSISQDNASNELGFSLTRAQYQELLGLLRQQKPSTDASPSTTSSQPKHANISQFLGNLRNLRDSHAALAFGSSETSDGPSSVTRIISECESALTVLNRDLGILSASIAREQGAKMNI
ncbi:unnamed protein product, partial [Sphenostylis stenocarpa]